MINPRAIAWKHGNAEGISTFDGQLIEWPKSLGPWPTDTQTREWEKEYLAFLATPSPITTLLAKPDADWSIQDIKAALRVVLSRDTA